MNLDQFIEKETSFITDIEEIVDVLYEAKQVYLYDTSAVSSHELGFHHHQDLTFSKYTQGAPILLTDTIAKEMRLTEDQNFRYLTYLSHFRKVFYIKEINFFDLLKVDYELTAARRKFIMASERAFSTIQLLRERVKDAKKHFSKAEQLITSASHSFFTENEDANRGEFSLLWVSAIIEQLPGTANVTFVGIDHDLYDFVERSYFSTPKVSLFSNDITFLSDDTLIQSDYRNNYEHNSLVKRIEIYRKPERKTRYHRKINKVLNLNQQKEKISNEDFLQLLIHDEIEIIY